MMLSQMERDLKPAEKEIVREELEAKNNKIILIFRFLLQSGQYQFFIRRLKNAIMAKLSLKQLKTNETILTKRKNEKC